MQWLHLPDDLTRHLGNIQHIQKKIYNTYIDICIYIYAVAISRKERLCLTPVQSFESNVCAMRLEKSYFGDPSWKMHF